MTTARADIPGHTCCEIVNVDIFIRIIRTKNGTLIKTRISFFFVLINVLFHVCEQNTYKLFEEPEWVGMLLIQ